MARLTASQLAEFEEQGYLLVRDLLHPQEDLDPIIAEYGVVLDRLADELYGKGEIPSKFDSLPFGRRLTRIYRESGRVYPQYFDFSLPQRNVEEDSPIWVGPAVFRALTNPRLLDAVEAFIGPEIYSNPVQHVRIKPPEKLIPEGGSASAGVGPTNWHQDNGVVQPEADQTQMLTVWFPLLDAPIESGCLKLIPGSHKEGLLTHCPSKAGGPGIPDQLLREERMVPMPMRRGDVLFFHCRTCHGSLSNLSDDIRWSFDLRYNPIGQATGREIFPGFVARSRAHPETELRDPEAWAQLWYDTRTRLTGNSVAWPLSRWSADAAVCA